MSKEKAALRHEEFKQAINRASDVAETEFEKAQVELFDKTGFWLREVHLDACNGIIEARKAHRELNNHKIEEKARMRGIKWFAAILGAVIAAISVTIGLIALFWR